MKAAEWKHDRLRHNEEHHEERHMRMWKAPGDRGQDEGLSGAARRSGETVKAAHAHKDIGSCSHWFRQHAPQGVIGPAPQGVIGPAPSQTGGPQPNRSLSYGSWSKQRAQASLTERKEGPYSELD